MIAMDRRAQRLRAGWASVAHRARSTGDCPSPAVLWAAARGELASEQTRKLGLHAIACPACAEAWRLAREIAAGAFPVPETPAPEDAPAFISRARLVWGGLAAAAVVVLVALIQFGGPPEKLMTPGFRAPADEPIQSLIPAEESLSREHCVLRWAGPEGARYEIRVATKDLGILVEARGLVVGEYQVPEEDLVDLPSGVKLLWQVKTTLPDGRRLSSRTFVSTVE